MSPVFRYKSTKVMLDLISKLYVALGVTVQKRHNKQITAHFYGKKNAMDLPDT